MCVCVCMCVCMCVCVCGFQGETELENCENLRIREKKAYHPPLLQQTDLPPSLHHVQTDLPPRHSYF